MSTLFQDAICFFTTSRSTALIKHVFLLLRAVKGSARRFAGNCGRWAERGPLWRSGLEALKARTNRFGPCLFHACGRTYLFRIKGYEYKYYLVSLELEASKLV